jgi:hypothetical protein
MCKKGALCININFFGYNIKTNYLRNGKHNHIKTANCNDHRIK